MEDILVIIAAMVVIRIYASEMVQEIVKEIWSKPKRDGKG